MQPSKASLLGLHGKYQTLRALRVELQASPYSEIRGQLAALAAAFPGALRELDRLPLACIEERLSALERALTRDGEAEPWMQLQVAYHGFMRAALRIRRLSRDRPLDVIDAMAELAALPYLPAHDEPAVSRIDVNGLRAIRKPPGGRLNPWVLEQVARDHGVTPELVQRALFAR